MLINSIMYFVFAIGLIALFRYMKHTFKKQHIVSQSQTTSSLISLSVFIGITALKHIRFFLTAYIGSIGAYIIISRIEKHSIYPSNEPMLEPIFKIIVSKDAQQVINVFMLYIIFIYIVFILPKAIFTIYDKWRDIYNKDDVLMKCIDKISSRLKKQNNKSSS